MIRGNVLQCSKRRRATEKAGVRVCVPIELPLYDEHSDPCFVQGLNVVVPVVTLSLYRNKTGIRLKGLPAVSQKSVNDFVLPELFERAR